MTDRTLKRCGTVFLLVLLGAFGWVGVPAHITSIWMDREFTDWISPIANRLHGDARLYTDGMHIPMPPLPYVLLRWLFPNGALWIHSNLLNYIFQCALILLLYRIFCKIAGTALAFAATVATVPLFMCLGKTILYDSMAQFLAAVCGVLCAWAVDKAKAGGGAARISQLYVPALTGVSLGGLLLTKQSTGLGASLGVGMVLVLQPAEMPFRRRCLNLMAVVLAAVATVCLVSLALSSFMSFGGMIQDVFLGGAEPKGGSRRMMNNLARFAYYSAKVLLAVGAGFCFLWAIFRRKLKLPGTGQATEMALDLPILARSKSARVQLLFVLLAMITSAVWPGVMYWLPAQSGLGTAFVKIANLLLNVDLLDVGLAACLVLGIAMAFSGRFGMAARIAHNPLAPYAVIFFAAAVFHNLSVTSFRWWSDNNPLIALAMVFVLSPFIGAYETDRPAWQKFASIAAACACVSLMWWSYFGQMKLEMSCTEPWPEIPHLAGARLRPECEGMRQLVNTVRSSSSESDTVLMLPDDPNVEAWIDRKRPAVSSAILFADQYWDKYVDRDFAFLRDHPPKFIIIGPRNYWRHFSHTWHWQKEEGVIRLIDRVQDELLPNTYELRVAQRISFGGGEDFMDVWERRSQ